MNMKAIHTASYLFCAGAILFGGATFHAPLADAQSAPGQSQNDARVRQLQAQPPKVNTEQEWRAAVEFMQAHCPNRINFVLTQLQNRPLQLDHARELILKQYRQIANTKDREHDMAVAQAEVQDKVFGALLEYRAAKARNDAIGAQKAQFALHKAEEDQVDIQIALRRLRILRLQQDIERFQKQRQSYANNWAKDELNRANNGEFDDGGARRSGDAAILDNDPSTPTKK